MKTKDRKAMPKVVSQAEWQAGHEQLLKKEKAATRARDALAAERRRMPMVEIEKDYAFEGPEGKVSLLDLFDGRRQLVLYHSMFAPGVEGWPATSVSRPAEVRPSASASSFATAIGSFGPTSPTGAASRCWAAPGASST